MITRWLFLLFFWNLSGYVSHEMDFMHFGMMFREQGSTAREKRGKKSLVPWSNWVTKNTSIVSPFGLTTQLSPLLAPALYRKIGTVHQPELREVRFQRFEIQCHLAFWHKNIGPYSSRSRNHAAVLLGAVLLKSGCGASARHGPGHWRRDAPSYQLPVRGQFSGVSRLAEVFRCEAT